ncbi:MAG: GDSL-type esterase/lipase family protein [Ruminococcus sp.]|nr:GDSL-type esterase/lipase family protein [Ruminococcus sp.]
MSNKSDGISKLKAVLKTPEFSMLVLVIISIIIVCSSALKSADNPDGNVVPSAADKSVSDTTSVTSDAEITTAESTEESDETETAEETVTETEPVTEPVTETVTETTTETTTTEPVTTTMERIMNLSPYINAGPSPNSDLYSQLVAVAGDSIAYGFNAYNYIPYERNFAQESVSMWNLNGFTFCGGFGLVDAVCYYQPSILYMSMGMNDVNMNTASIFASQYIDVIKQITANCPNTVIVVAGISPVAYDSYFTTNTTIREYNSALQMSVNSLGNDNVLYFDAYSVLCDEYLNLRYDCDSGDGIHLQTHCYEDWLKALYNFLDAYRIYERFQY